MEAVTSAATAIQTVRESRRLFLIGAVLAAIATFLDILSYNAEIFAVAKAGTVFVFPAIFSVLYSSVRQSQQEGTPRIQTTTLSTVYAPLTVGRILFTILVGGVLVLGAFVGFSLTRPSIDIVPFISHPIEQTMALPLSAQAIIGSALLVSTGLWFFLQFYDVAIVYEGVAAVESLRYSTVLVGTHLTSVSCYFAIKLAVAALLVGLPKLVFMGDGIMTSGIPAFTTASVGAFVLNTMGITLLATYHAVFYQQLTYA